MDGNFEISGAGGREGLVTIAFIGRTPVKTESRSAIDNEIHRGTGA